MDAATRTKFNATIDIKLGRMISEAQKLRDLSVCKPLGSSQVDALNHLLAILNYGVKKSDMAMAAFMEAAE